MSKRIPVAWADRARLRLILPGEVVALYDGAAKLSPERYVLDERAGLILLMAEPAGAITAELREEAPVGRPTPPTTE
ncbi:hypothetical protein [Roseococcus pinisoli]|uniref:Uncharacterized protein n=1 Tax=Roseococcus pinisoli TaxID=2835040 RepID=A0ABS5QA51_9PROT|nr:hypothetical protein [Roseococcus pinisoli]MBS7810535.1 hypothetical protein [Roseococcus pinisoli]